MTAPETKKPDFPRKGRSLPRILLILSGLGILGFLAVEAAVLFSGMASNTTLRHLNPSTTAFIEAYSRVTGKIVALQWTPLGDTSDLLKRAVIVAEDDTFLEHQGYNLRELEESWAKNLKKKKVSRGGSTITMQLVKNLYISKSKNPVRKINELVLAMDMEKKLSKERILEIYLNVVEWGDGIFGVTAASRHYFRKEPRSLGAEEAAFLAAILPNPVYLTTRNTRRAQWRKRMILGRLHWTQIPKNF